MSSRLIIQTFIQVLTMCSAGGGAQQGAGCNCAAHLHGSYRCTHNRGARSWRHRGDALPSCQVSTFATEAQVQHRNTVAAVLRGVECTDATLTCLTCHMRYLHADNGLMLQVA